MNLNEKESERRFNDFNSSTLTVSLNQVRKNRKVADSDVQKLHNRIRMLKLEEDKALKKIEETRRKAKKILESRFNEEQRQLSRRRTILDRA